MQTVTRPVDSLRAWPARQLHQHSLSHKRSPLAGTLPTIQATSLPAMVEFSASGNHLTGKTQPIVQPRT